MVEAKKSTTYEETRKKRLQENKRRMEELNLNKLAHSLHTPKPSPMKKIKMKLKQPVDPSSVRRSSRVADLPPRTYKEVAIEPMGRPRKYGYGRRNLLNRVYASDDDRNYAIQRAEDLQASLDQDIPSFIKPMLQSHVTGGFWLGLPVKFCKTHLPNEDATLNLVNEEGGEYPTKYLALKTGLSGGWRGFAIEHELVDGDALVFELIQPTTFKDGVEGLVEGEWRLSQMEYIEKRLKEFNMTNSKLVYIIRVNEPGEKSD